MSNPMPKLKNEPLTWAHVQERARRIMAAGYRKSAWLVFAEALLPQGYSLLLYEALRTNSKYITVWLPNHESRPVKVRFSDHRPVPERELAGDCDFWVGRSNAGTFHSAQDALRFVQQHFNR